MMDGLTAFAELIVETRDGEWGEGEETPGHALCEVVRGTDFAHLYSPGVELPRRWVPEHLVARKALLAGDILIETAGGTAKQSTGRTALITAEFLARRQGTPVLCSSFARHLRVDRTKVCPEYLYFVLQALYRAGYMAVFNLQHTGVSRFQFTSFKNKTALRLHSVREQAAVAAMLSTYDDMIASNQRRVALLETMAEEIYREWFVRMRFPGHGSAEREHLLPVGWGRKPLAELSELIKRGISPDYSEVAEGVVLNQKCIRDGKVSLAEARQHQTRVPDDKLVRYGDVLINSTGVGTLGRVAVFDIERSGITCDSHITILRPNAKLAQPEYLGHTVAKLQGYFESMAAGSTGQSELSRDLIAKTKVVVPVASLQSEFAARVMPMRQQRRALLMANEVLARMRDSLLPRLISGKLKVDHLDIRMPPNMQAVAPA